MSNLPSELTDHIIDLLHDSQAPLRSCCLVSKSWVPRTRMHLFAKVEFQTAASLESWKKTFRDPSTSPACYTKTLLVDNSKVLTDADAEGNGWIGDFSRVVHFTTVGPDPASFDRVAVLLPFHGFSPFLKSLRVHHTIFSLSQLFDPIFSFPLLEDLSITDCCCLADKAGDPDEVSTTIQPASPPMFTGSLELFMTGMIRPVHWLLSLPGGIHFRKLTLTWTCKEDISLTMALLEKCSHTLESLDVTCGSLCVDPMSVPFDLSKATKLGYAVFRPESLGIGWITRLLRAITNKHQAPRRISVELDVLYFGHSPHVYGDVRKAVGEEIFEEWLDLDRILVHLWESLSIRVNVRWVGRVEVVVTDYVGRLLPETTRRGMVTLDPV